MMHHKDNEILIHIDPHIKMQELNLNQEQDQEQEHIVKKVMECFTEDHGLVLQKAKTIS